MKMGTRPDEAVPDRVRNEIRPCAWFEYTTASCAVNLRHRVPRQCTRMKRKEYANQTTCK